MHTTYVAKTKQKGRQIKMSDFVNKNTGEVFEVEDTNLANICDGDLDFIFKQELQKLTKEMKEASKMLEFEYAAILRDRIIELRGEG